MKFLKVDEVPKRRSDRHNLKEKWDEFMLMNVKVVKIGLADGEYTNPSVARSVMYRSITHYGYPIDILKRGDEIYLVRRDM